MKRIILLVLVFAFLVSFNACFASDVNSTDIESSVDDVTTPDNALKASINSSDVLKSSTVKHIDSSKSIKASDLTKYHKNPKPYTAKFYKSNGKALTNTKVKVSVNTKNYIFKTDNTGKVKLKINLRPGDYKITANNPKTGFKLTTNIKILPLIKSSDLTKVYKNNKKFSAKFLKSNGKALANTKVKYKLNGTINTIKTDKKGFIHIPIKEFKKGKYKIKLYHPSGFKKTSRIKVVTTAKTRLSAEDYKFLKSSAKTIKVKLKDQFGYKVSSGYIIKAKIDGKTYKAKTNKNGVVKFKLKSINKGFHTAQYSFNGKGYYKSSISSSQITVYPSKKAKFTVKSTTTFGYGAHTPFNLKVTSGSIPLIKKTVTFHINGKTYKKTTDKEGMVSLPINMKVGKYTLKYSIKKDSLIDAKEASSKITVKKRISTSLTWIGNTSIYQGYSACQIQLKDANNKAIGAKSVTLKIKDATYTATTSVDGIAMFDAVTPPGLYDISYSFNGDNDYKNAHGTVRLNSTYKVVNGYGYWLKMEQFGSVNYDNLTSLARQGVSDIFLNADSLTSHGREYVESWIANATNVGIRVHFWLTVFKDTITNTWTSAIENGQINTGFYTQRIDEIKELSKINGISGIHLDYLRFKSKAYKISGSTEAINEFAKQATSAIRNINKELIISCAVSSRMGNGAYHFGQDFSVLSQYMDVIMPMVYKGNAGQPRSWITSTTKWYVDNSKGAKIWAGLQTYKSDSDITVLTMDEMNGDTRAALSGGADGLVLFRWGLTSYIDFNNLI